MAERSLGIPSPGARARLVDATLALQAWAEIFRGPRAISLVERAVAALGDDPLGRELALQHARCLRLSGDMDGFERALAAIDPETLPPRHAARWNAEHAQGLRFRRELDAAVAHLERAIALVAEHGPQLEEARYTIDLGGMRYWQQRFDEAVVLYGRGRTLAAQLGAKRTEAIALSNLCLCHSFVGDESAAAQSGHEAVALLEVIGDAGALGSTLGHLGILAYQYGRLRDAAELLEAAEARVEATGYFEQRVYVRFNRTCVALAAGRVNDAEALLRSLPAMLAASPSPLVSMHLERLESDLHEHRGRLAEARAALERGIALAIRQGALDVRARLAAQLARVLARLGEHAISAERAAEARRALESVTRDDLRAPCDSILEHAAFLRGEGLAIDVLAEALRPSWEGIATRTRVGTSAVDSGAVREASVAFWKDLAPSERALVEWTARDPSVRAICLDERAERARLPGGAELEASTRRNAYRVLWQLADAGDAGIERDALIEATWPGERMRDDAATNRLHNALAQLRSAGLASFVTREQTSYRLSNVRVVIAGRASPFASDG